MAYGHWVSTATVALALVGCTEFASAQTGSGGGAEASDGSTNPPGSSNETQTSAGTTSAGGSTSGAADPTNTSSTDPTNASQTATTNASNTETTNASNTETAASTAGAESGTGGDDEGSTTGGDDEATSDPTTGVKICNQQDEEPNDFDNETEIVDLGDVECGPDTYNFGGTIEDADDEDWLFYFGDWICGSPNPRVVVDVADNNVEVCTIAICQQENITAFYNCVDGDNWFEGGSNLGCCSSDVVRMDVNCSGTTDESLFASFRVRSNDAVCEDYTLTYAFEVQP